MQSNQTVILGEASESDSEEIPLGEDYTANSSNLTSSRTNDGHSEIIGKFPPSQPTNQASQSIRHNGETIYDDPDKFKNYGKGMFGSSIFASISSVSSLAKLAGNYSPYNLLNPVLAGTQDQDKNSSNTSKNFINQLPPLHKSLYTKNQQLYACLAHVYRHPYEKANKDIQSINQRLVIIQKTIQELDNEVMKIKREEKNLDIKVNLIT